MTSCITLSVVFVFEHSNLIITQACLSLKLIPKITLQCYQYELLARNKLFSDQN